MSGEILTKKYPKVASRLFMLLYPEPKRPERICSFGDLEGVTKVGLARVPQNSNDLFLYIELIHSSHIVARNMILGALIFSFDEVKKLMNLKEIDVTIPIPQGFQPPNDNVLGIEVSYKDSSNPGEMFSWARKDGWSLASSYEADELTKIVKTKVNTSRLARSILGFAEQVMSPDPTPLQWTLGDMCLKR